MIILDLTTQLCVMFRYRHMKIHVPILKYMSTLKEVKVGTLGGG